MTTRWVAVGLGCWAALAHAQVPFVSQTAAVPTGTSGDLAILPTTAGPIIVAGDPLQNGLYVFGPDGGLADSASVGVVRGVDARRNLPLPTVKQVVAVSAQSQGGVLLRSFVDGGLTDVATPIPVMSPGALSLRVTPRELEVLVDARTGVLTRYSLHDDGGQGLIGEFLEDIPVPEVASGIAIDDRTGMAYVAFPALGLYRVNIDFAQLTPLAPIDGGQFLGLLGGVAFYPLGDGGGLVLTTVPSRDEVVVHELEGSQATFRARFTVGDMNGQARAPSAVDVVPNRIAGFDAGLLVLHDSATATYKLVDWAALAEVTQLPVDVPEDRTMDAGAGDAGLSDGGVRDGGSTDGGRDGGGGGNIGGVIGGGGATPPPNGCGCTTLDVSFLPAALALAVWSRRRRGGAS